MVQLSSLEFLPPSGDASGRITPPTIVAVRSHLPVPISHYNQDVYTTVDRWEVCEKPQTLHPAFEQLSSRRNSLGSQPGVSSARSFLKRLYLRSAERTLSKTTRKLYSQQDSNCYAVYEPWKSHMLCVQ